MILRTDFGDDVWRRREGRRGRKVGDLYLSARRQSSHGDLLVIVIHLIVVLESSQLDKVSLLTFEQVTLTERF